MNLTNDFKRVLSGMLSVAMTATLVQSFPAIAEDAQTTKYPYAVFASSDIEGAITVNAGNFCVNGNVATNGTIVASGNMNINGSKTEKACEDMIYIFDKIDSAYFSESNVNEYSDDYILEEMNINITTPTEIMGEAIFTGNININTALKAFENVNLYGEVKNTNDSVIFSKYGDIVIDSQNVNLNGLVYAPFGNVVVTAQNLNLNNVVIIADTITFNCPNVNANYSSSAAEFVGTVSEPLDIPYDEWQYMKDENENDFPDFFEDFDNWSKLKDTDGDKLPDCVEQYIGSDSALVDTDGDALDDFYELFVTYTEPAKNDTDDNGILDCDEDFDKDDLSNLEEYLASTSPWDDDTDSDTLKDGEEIDTYGTDPLKSDTDDDGLEDSDEIYLGTDPVNPDTDSDGILDGDEKFYQTYTHIVENEDCVVSEVIVSLEGTGNLQKNTTIKSVMNKDVLCTNVAGLVGEPFNIETSSQFDTATITFKIDQSKLGDTEFDNLMFLWYDEENNEFVELETVLDEQNSTVSVVTTHFSEYMIVDRQAWYDAWALEFNYGRQFDNSGAPLRIYNTVLAIDCSGSMTSYDSDGEIRTNAALGLIGVMNPNDRIAVVLFDSYVNRFMALTNDQAALTNMLNRIYSSGGTDFDAALQSSIALLQDEIGMTNVINRIIFMTDGQDSISTNVLDVAKDNNIKIYTIGFSTNTSDSNLQYYADYTGGEFYKAYNAEELIGIYENLGSDSDFDTTDTDGDGLFDVVEIAGMRMQNGYVGGENGAPLTTDPTNPDTDGDGLLDGEEIDQTISWKRVINDTGDGSHGTYCIYFNMLSDPTKVNTDGDGLQDKVDPVPLKSFDQRFDVVEDYTIMPTVDFVESELVKSKNDYLTETSISNEAFQLLMKLVTSGGSIVGGNTGLVSIILSLMNEQYHKIQYGKLPNATAALDHFLLGSGSTYSLSAGSVCDSILSTNNNVLHLKSNVLSLMNVVEQTTKDNSMTLTSVSDAGFMSCCYYKKGGYCNETHSTMSTFENVYSMDWYNTTGESFGGMTCQAFNYDDTYCMTFRYYIIDIYEWVEAEDDPLSTMLHNLHKAGQAQEYLLNGYFESTVTWKKGEGVSNEVMRQIYIDMINQMIDDNIITLQMFSEDNQDMLRESLIGNGSQPPQYDLCRIIDIPIVIE